MTFLHVQIKTATAYLNVPALAKHNFNMNCVINVTKHLPAFHRIPTEHQAQQTLPYPWFVCYSSTASRRFWATVCSRLEYIGGSICHQSRSLHSLHRLFHAAIPQITPFISALAFLSGLWLTFAMSLGRFWREINWPSRRGMDAGIAALLVIAIERSADFCAG